MNNLFKNITILNKEKILKSLEGNTLYFKKNNTILTNIKHENIIAIILEGYVQIVKTDYNGNRTIIEDLYDNDIFSSKMSNISNNEYSIITKEDTKLIIIYFDEILNNDLNTSYYNQFLKNLLFIMSDKMTNINNRIEILSRGTLAPAQTEEGFFAGESVPVNDKLSEIFLQLHISEKSGRGVPKIVEIYGKEAITFRENSIVVSIPFNRIHKIGRKSEVKAIDRQPLNARRQAILTEIGQNPYITIEDLASKLGVSDTTIDNNISFLKKKGYIRRKGKKGGYWEIIE